jgi:hypothetical protein
MLLALTALAFVWLGYEIAIRRVRNAGALEIANAAVTIGSALWLASVWLPALLHRLDRPTMLVRTGVVLCIAVVLFLRRTRGGITIEWMHVALLTPILAWIAFVAWRSAIVPPLSHDALAYHLPRAVLWIREHAFTWIDLPVDARMRILPANYELLLADAILLGGSDALTEWLSIFFYVAFLIAAGALAQRWWPRHNKATVAVVLLSACMPVLLLHSGGDKNDIMTAFFMLSALVWAGRWFTERDVDALVLCAIAIIAAIGTKPQGLMLAAALLPFVLWRIRVLKLATMARVLAICLVAAILLGGAFYIVRAMHENGDERRAFVAYNDWANLWQAPWVLLAAPFTPHIDELYVPWARTPWYWGRYEIYFSHLGAAFAICTLLLPWTIARFRRDAPERAAERHAMAIAAFVTLLLMLPVRDVPMPRGVYTIALPRYVMFLGPVVFALSAAPAISSLSQRYAKIALATLAAWFVIQAVDCALNDRFVPIEYVAALREHPGSRVIAFDLTRAASIADRVVPPHEPIWFDAGYAAWIHPAFGRDLQRPVHFIGAPIVPADAKWVVVDRSFRIIWQHEQFRELSQAATYLSRGTPTERDTSIVRQLLHDSHWRTVYYNRPRNQAVFQRMQ